jgi:hypothetical protein
VGLPVLNRFRFDILRCSIRGGKRHNLSSVILKRCRGTPSADDLPHQHLQSWRRTDAESERAAAVTAKLGDGNITGAVRILFRGYSGRILRGNALKLRVKHPACTSSIPHPVSTSVTHLACQATETEVMKNDHNILAGSAAGSERISATTPVGDGAVPRCRQRPLVSEHIICQQAAGWECTIFQAYILRRSANSAEQEVWRHSSHRHRLHLSSSCRQVRKRICCDKLASLFARGKSESQ